MNERIKELLEQAGVKYVKMPNDTVYAKFAELLVKECTNIVLHYTDVDEGVAVAKKHFGVE